jgi:hypothetical protein
MRGETIRSLVLVPSRGYLEGTVLVPSRVLVGGCVSTFKVLVPSWYRRYYNIASSYAAANYTDIPSTYPGLSVCVCVCVCVLTAAAAAAAAAPAEAMRYQWRQRWQQARPH